MVAGKRFIQELEALGLKRGQQKLAGSNTKVWNGIRVL